MMDIPRKRISPKELKALGWQRNAQAAPCRVTGIFGRDYTHKDGWKISHCGHPTAIWPYLLTDPAGRIILTGARVGNPPNFGTAWPTVAEAVDYVATQTKEAR